MKPEPEPRGARPKGTRMSLKNWNWKHGLIAAAFVVGVLWSGGAAIAALPAGQSAAAVLAALAPIALLGISHIVAFFKSPPSDPVTALQEGEQALGGASAAAKAASRGLARLGVLLAFAAIGVVCFTMQAFTGAPVIHPMTVQGQGCSWWQKNSNIVEQYGERDVECVLSSIMSGAASPAAVATMCAPLTVSQVLQVAESLFSFYALQQTDSGLAGVARPPALGLKPSLTPEEFAKLEAFVRG